jgi:hypothetical protein
VEGDAEGIANDGDCPGVAKGDIKDAAKGVDEGVADAEIGGAVDDSITEQGEEEGGAEGRVKDEDCPRVAKGPMEGASEGEVLGAVEGDEEGDVEGDGTMEGKADNKSVLAFNGVESIAKSVEEEKRPDALADEQACAKASCALLNVNVYVCTTLRCLCFISLSFPVVFPLTFPFFPLSLTRFTFWPKMVTTIFPPR